MTNKKKTVKTAKVEKKVDTKESMTAKKRVKSLTTQNSNLKDKLKQAESTLTELALLNFQLDCKKDAYKHIVDEQEKIISKLNKRLKIVNHAQDSIRYEITGQLIDHIIEKSILIDKQGKETCTKKEIIKYNEQLIKKIRKISDKVVVKVVQKTMKELEDLE